MTDPCRDWRGALGAAALGGIDPAEEIGLRAHLDGCAVCRAELRELTAVAGALASVPLSAVVGAAAEPPDALGERVLSRLARERGAVRSRHFRQVLVGAGSLMTVAAAVIAAVLMVGGGSGTGGLRVVLPGVGAERATATATAVLHSETGGTAVDVKVSGLHPGDYYWLWVTGDDGHRLPAGTFQGSQHQTEFRLTAAMPLSEARRIWVTDDQDRVVLDAHLPVST
jgi:anti-sigma factor RsiW